MLITQQILSSYEQFLFVNFAAAAAERMQNALRITWSCNLGRYIGQCYSRFAIIRTNSRCQFWNRHALAMLLWIYVPVSFLFLNCHVQGDIFSDIWTSVKPLLTNATCALDWETILTTVLLKGSFNQCNLCHLVNELTSTSTCMRNNHSHLPIEQLVNLHCVKA